MKRILILGADGFVGRHVVAALAREPGVEPVALVRRATDALPSGTTVRRADATDPVALRRALEGIEAVVNCIAGSEATMVAVTRNLVAAEVRCGIHLSSMAVYGEATGLVDEDSPRDAAGNAYARAKIACEDIVSSAAARWVVLRPGCIHGPGSSQWTERIGRLLRQHRIGDLGERGDGICNLTFIDDLVRAILAALRHPGALGGTFNVSDPAPKRWNAYLIGLGLAIGAVPITRVSRRWHSAEVKLLAPALVGAGRILGKTPLRVSLPPAVTPSLARLWRQEITLDHRRADAALGFFRTPPERAIAEAAEWFRTRD